MMSSRAEREVLYRHSSNEEFSFKENWDACFVGHGLLSLALWGDSGHLIIRVVFEMQVKNTISIG